MSLPSGYPKVVVELRTLSFEEARKVVDALCEILPQLHSRTTFELIYVAVQAGTDTRSPA